MAIVSPPLAHARRATSNAIAGIIGYLLLAATAAAVAVPLAIMTVG